MKQRFDQDHIGKVACLPHDLIKLTHFLFQVLAGKDRFDRTTQLGKLSVGRMLEIIASEAL